MGGGMVQTQLRDGSWKDAFVIDGYKTHNAVNNVSAKTHRPARLINRKGKVLYSTNEEKTDD